jgi:drug/metabolite transporter (DMT)-like permease
MDGGGRAGAVDAVSDHPVLKGVACVLFSILIWAGWMVISRYGVKGSLTSYDITAIRFGVAGALLLPVAIKRGLAVGPYGLKGGLLLAILIGAPYTNLAIAGMVFAPASHASTLINGTLLVLTTAVGIHGLKEETSRLRLLGVACSLIGIACMLAAKSATSSPMQWFGHLLFIISGLMWGSYTLLVRAWRADAMQAAAAVCVFSLIFYLPFYLLFAQSHIGLSNWREVAFQAVYQGLLTGVIALVSFNTGIRLLGASHAGAFIPLVPVLATILAIPVLGEVPSVLEWTGVAAVSSGVFLASGVLSWRAASASRTAAGR